MASVPQSEQLARTPEQSFPKGKGTESFSRSPDREVEDSEGELEPRLGEREKGIGAGAWGGKGGLHGEERQVSGRRVRESKKNLPRRSRRKHKRVSGRKAHLEDLESLSFTPSLAKPEMGKEIGRRRARS